MPSRRPHRIYALTNVYDEQYTVLRGEAIAPVLSSPKRRDLFESLEMASGRELIILSSPPKALARRSPRWLSPVETRFARFRQSFCAIWDIPKLRIILGWWFYALHVVRHVRAGDLVIIDNFEFLYIIAALALRMVCRVIFVLDYEDGKHLIDQGIDGFLSRMAERIGRRLIRGALVVHPQMVNRLPANLPTLFVPGFVREVNESITKLSSGVTRFLYSGSLDQTRGVDLLLEALPLLPQSGWELHCTGVGELEKALTEACNNQLWKGKVKFYGSLGSEAYVALLKRSHVGLNCQRASDPISAVTFPSKIFTYISAGLDIVSSRAGAVEHVCGNACLYYDEETPGSLSSAMCRAMTEQRSELRKNAVDEMRRQYSIGGTADRARSFIAEVESAI